MQKQVEEEKQAVQTLLSAKESELVSVNQDLKEASSQAEDVYKRQVRGFCRVCNNRKEHGYLVSDNGTCLLYTSYCKRSV